MKEEDLKRLIEKYYNGESTEEEELILKEFFRKGNVPRGYEAEKEIFGHYDVSDIPEPSHDFETQILAAIDASGKQKERTRRNRILLPALSAAAGILILTGSYFLFIRKSSAQDSFKDPQIAYTETVRILFKVSGEMNRGSRTLEPVGRINKVSASGFKSMNKAIKIVGRNLGYLQKAAVLTNDSEIMKNKNK